MLPENIFSDHRPHITGMFTAGMPDHWFQAGQLKYALDVSEGVLKPLEYKLWDIAVRMKDRLNWKTRKGDIGKSMLRRLAQLAICEMNAPARFNTPDAWQLRAAFIGVSKSSWFGTWSGRYKVLFDEFNEWTNRAYRYVKIRVRKMIRDADDMAEYTIEHEMQWVSEMFGRVA